MRQNLTRKTVANRCNFGILPLTFQDPKDHESIQPGDQLLYPDIRRRLEAGETKLPVGTGRRRIIPLLEVAGRARQHLLAGGTSNFARQTLK
jgi:aconitate hydratase